MAAFVPPPADAVGAAPIGDLFQNYDATGALNGLFAPAYIPGFAQSEQAVAGWNNGHRMTREEVEQTRMPALYKDPYYGMDSLAAEHMYLGQQNNNGYVGGGPYGEGRIGSNVSFGDARGTVDPQALKAMAQGGSYDMGARRDAIAARVLENEAGLKHTDDRVAGYFNAKYGRMPGAPGVVDPLAYDPERQQQMSMFGPRQYGSD